MILAQILIELSELVRAPATILSRIRLMEDRLMAEIEQLRNAIAAEITEALDAFKADLDAANARATSAEEAKANIDAAFADFRARTQALTDEVRAPGLFGQETTTTTVEDTTTTVDEATTTVDEATTTEVPVDEVTTTVDEFTTTVVEEEPVTTTVNPNAPRVQPGTGFDPING